MSVLHHGCGLYLEPAKEVSASTIDGASYTVDSAGNRTAKTDQRLALTTNYGYDPIYQLLSATQGGSTTESYTYDPVGNRLSSLGVASYSNNTSNELTATSNASYTYDLNGNALTKAVGSNTTTYAWDYENRLASVILPGTGGTVGFKYDPFGRRIYKSSSTATSVYAYDGDNLIEETNASGAVVARYSQGLNIDEPLAMLRSSATSFYHADGLGTVTSLSNGSGALAQTYTFDSFGKQTAASGSLTNPFQYTGRESDPETGLYYYRARYYDPQTGRLLSEDPLEFEGDGPNFYKYVLNDPTDLGDPFGLNAQPIPLPYKRLGPELVPDLVKRNIPFPWGRIVGGVALAIIGELLNPEPTARDEDLLPKNKPDCDKGKGGCKPCVPPVGTRAYREDTNPNSPAHHGVPVPHWRLYEMQQNPHNCQCFWKKVPENEGGFGPSPPPAGVAPIGPVGGGGTS